MFAKLLPFILKIVPKLLGLLEKKTGIKPKVGAGGLAGTIVFLIIVGLPMLGSPPVDEAVAAAIAVLVSFGAAWLKTNDSPG